MSEWKEYTGSDEQIAEIKQCKTDVLFRQPSGREVLRSNLFIADWAEQYEIITHYLICQPHPLADMICQQARTGQPVWVREFTINGRYVIAVTATPDWNIPGAEYRFTPFEEEV